MSPGPRGAIVIFAKAPRPGLVKTRMCPPLSAEEAAELYANLLRDVLAHTVRVASQLGLEPWLAVHPADACAELAAGAPPGTRVIAQRGRDLGERMRWAAAEVFAAGFARALLRGSDSPTLDEARLSAALEALERLDLVLCPDLDGGYSLLGLRRPAPELFELAMSTPSLFAETRACASQLGLSSGLVEPCFDVDRVEDLAELARARRRGDTSMCRRTLAFLDQRGLWTGLEAGPRGAAKPPEPPEASARRRAKNLRAGEI